MSEPRFLDAPHGCRIAHHRTEGWPPGIVFLPGLRSDMEGDKALRIEAFARSRGQACLRFDYSGHGASGGAFADGTIGAWAEDARAVIDAATEGPQVLVGSSMGGWIALLLARADPGRVHALVTIAAAPDFTEDGYWASWSEDERERLMREGRIEEPSDYGEPMIITRALIEDGRRHLVLREPLALPMPVRMLQGTADAAVPTETALRLLAHAEGPDIRLTLVKNADHRLSDPASLDLLERTVAELL